MVSLFRYFFSAFSEVEPVDWSRSGSDSSNPNVESTVGEHPLIMLWNRPPGRTVTWQNSLSPYQQAPHIHRSNSVKANYLQAWNFCITSLVICKSRSVKCEVLHFICTHTSSLDYRWNCINIVILNKTSPCSYGFWRANSHSFIKRFIE